jgi:hypothetical protein
VLLGGYGCVNRNVSGGNDGVFRVGFSTVQLPIGHAKETPYYFTSVPNAESEAPAVLCPGDSGGAVFCLKDPKDMLKGRSVCGVNSAVDCLSWIDQETCADIGDRSYLSATHAASPWLKAQKVKLCGRDEDISQLCRQ